MGGLAVKAPQEWGNSGEITAAIAEAYSWHSHCAWESLRCEYTLANAESDPVHHHSV